MGLPAELQAIMDATEQKLQAADAADSAHNDSAKALEGAQADESARAAAALDAHREVTAAYVAMVRALQEHFKQENANG